MTFNLEKFSLVDMLQCGRGIRRAAADAESVEAAARSIVEYLHAECTTGGAAAQPCALIRFYFTLPFRQLEPQLQQFAGALLQDVPGKASVKCLTLLGTKGVEPEWGDRSQSSGHQAIPLPSDQIVGKAPMIAALLSQMGLDVATLHAADKSLVDELAGKTYDVFHVPEAHGSPYIPAQAEFVDKYGIRSVVGFGGLVHTGEMYAIVMFSRGSIPAEAAHRFRNIALDVKAIIHPLCDRRVFAT